MTVNEQGWRLAGGSPCPVHWRNGLREGTKLAGPIIIEAMDSTIVVPPGWSATVDCAGYVRIRRSIPG